MVANLFEPGHAAGARVVGDLVADVTDEDLLAQAGDPLGWEAACNSLIERHEALVRRTCLKALNGDVAAADEACQRTFIHLNRYARTLKQPVHLGGWLHRVATRVCISLRREEDRRWRHESLSGTHRAALAAGQETSEPALRQQIAQVIAALPAGQRSVVQLHCIEGLSQETVAQRLGLNPTALRDRLCAARSTIRRQLGRAAVSAGAVALLAMLPPEVSAAEVQAAVVRRPRGIRPAQQSTTTIGLAAGMAGALIVTAVWLWPVAVPANFSSDNPVAPLSTKLSAPPFVPLSAAPSVQQQFFQLGTDLVHSSAIENSTSAVTSVVMPNGGTELSFTPIPGAWGSSLTITFKVQNGIEGMAIDSFSSKMPLQVANWMGDVPVERAAAPLRAGLHRLRLETRIATMAPPMADEVIEFRKLLDGVVVSQRWYAGPDATFTEKFHPQLRVQEMTTQRLTPTADQ